MLSVLNPWYVHAMDRITFTTNYIPKFYDKEREQNTVNYPMLATKHWPLICGIHIIMKPTLV